MAPTEKKIKEEIIVIDDDDFVEPGTDNEQQQQSEEVLNDFSADCISSNTIAEVYETCHIYPAGRSSCSNQTQFELNHHSITLTI